MLCCFSGYYHFCTFVFFCFVTLPPDKRKRCQTGRRPERRGTVVCLCLFACVLWVPGLGSEGPAQTARISSPLGSPARESPAGRRRALLLGSGMKEPAGRADGAGQSLEETGSRESRSGARTVFHQVTERGRESRGVPGDWMIPAEPGASSQRQGPAVLSLPSLFRYVILKKRSAFREKAVLVLKAGPVGMNRCPTAPLKILQKSISISGKSHFIVIFSGRGRIAGSGGILIPGNCHLRRRKTGFPGSLRIGVSEPAKAVGEPAEPEEAEPGGNRRCPDKLRVPCPSPGILSRSQAQVYSFILFSGPPNSSPRPEVGRRRQTHPRGGLAGSARVAKSKRTGKAWPQAVSYLSR